MVGPQDTPSETPDWGGVAPVRKSVVTTEAVERIKEMIVERRLRPESKLPPERELCEMLGISRSSVREAIRALTHMNILEARQGQGTFVTSLSPQVLTEPLRFVMAVNEDLIYQLFEIRKMIETKAAALAAERITTEQLEELRFHYDMLVRSLDEPSVFLRHDVAMHELIARATRNDLLVSLFGSFFDLLLESRKRTGSVTAIRAQTIIDHGKILEVLEARDAERSSAAMLEHLDHVEGKLRELGGPSATSPVQPLVDGRDRHQGKEE
jgi:GntR family transcriptional repressor for pyruvate dehydrogenase complex